MLVARREGERIKYNDDLSANVRVCVMHAINLYPEGDFVEISFTDSEFAVMDNQANRIGGTMLPPGWKLKKINGKWTFVQPEEA
jgi:hypothetical protein